MKKNNFFSNESTTGLRRVVSSCSASRCPLFKRRGLHPLANAWWVLRLNNKGSLNIHIVILVSLVLMVSYWLVVTPKVDIFKTVQELPKLTIQKLTSPTTDQDSQVSKKPVVDQNAISKLSTKSVKNLEDLDKLSRDLDSTNVDNLDSSINQLETDVE